MGKFRSQLLSNGSCALPPEATENGAAPSSAEGTEGLPSAIEWLHVLSVAQAAKLTGLSEATLERLRAGGDGPPIIRLSARRIGYRLDRLLTWLDERSADRAA